MKLKKYAVQFLHHEVIRTEVEVKAENDVHALRLAFHQLVMDGWNEPGDLTWATSGEFSVNIYKA